VHRALVVVRGTPIFRSDGDAAAAEADHFTGARRTCEEVDGARRMVRLALLQLQRLKNRLIVLVLVLKDHVVNVSAPEQRIVIVPLEPVESVENARADLPQSRHHLGERRKRQRCARGAWMLERVVHSRHLRKLDRTIQILGEPEFLEVGDVPDVPDDRTHQRIVLPMQILVRESGYQQRRSIPRLSQETRDVGLGRMKRGGKPRCNHIKGSQLKLMQSYCRHPKLPSRPIVRRHYRPYRSSTTPATYGPTGAIMRQRISAAEKRGAITTGRQIAARVTTLPG